MKRSQTADFTGSNLFSQKIEWIGSITRLTHYCGLTLNISYIVAFLQRWVNALRAHISYSTYYMHKGVTDDSDEYEDLVPLSGMTDALQVRGNLLIHVCVLVKLKVLCHGQL